MDYEKMYKEALKRARANYKADKEMGFLENCDMLELIFPELAESEDERIRKELKEAFEAYDIESKWNGIPIRSIFAWLEKQKEQNGEDEECTDFTIYHPLKNRKGEYECIPYSFYGSLTSFSEDKDLIDFLRTCFYTEEECNEWIKQQNEQKPNYNNLPIEQQMEAAMIAIKGEMSSKSQECIEDSVKFEEGFKAGRESGLRDGQKYVLNNLDSYGLCKLAEWSEEDENMIDDIIRALTKMAESEDNILPEILPSVAQKYVERLKSLRPSWKPSEEQMKALTEEEEKPKEETPVEKERKRLEGNLKEEVCASDICAYRGKNVCTIKRDEYCPMFKPYKVRRNRNE